MLSHGNLLANLEQVEASEARRQEPGDVTLGVLPLFHIFGLNVVLGLSFHAGSTVLLVERFDPASAVEAIVRHRVTVIAGAPAMWAAWANLPDTGASVFQTVRMATSGAARLPAEVAERMRSRFGVSLAEGYGLTEASPVVTTATGLEHRSGSIGAPVPGVELRLVDADGSDVLVGDAGEIWVQGPERVPGLLERRRGHPDRPHRRRLAAHRRHRGGRRRRLPVPGRPGQGPHHRVGLQRVPGRGRGGAVRAPGHRALRGRRRAASRTRARR